MRKPIIIGPAAVLVAAALAATAFASQTHRHAARHATQPVHRSVAFQLPASTPAQENAPPVAADEADQTTTPDQPDVQQGDQNGSQDESADANDSQDETGETNDSQDQSGDSHDQSGDSQDESGTSNESQDQGGGSQGDQGGGND